MVDTNMNADYTKVMRAGFFLADEHHPYFSTHCFPYDLVQIPPHRQVRAPTHSLKGYLTDHDITCNVHSLCYRWTFCSFWFPFFAT